MRRKSMTTLVTIVATFLVFIASQTCAADPQTSGLLGSYTLIKGEKNGQQLPAERVLGSTVRITESSITTVDKDQKETYAVTYTLDTSQKPWKITMTSTLAPVKGEVAHGLIEKNGDTVKLIYGARGGAAPDDFTTEDKQLMFVMKKSS
jgi:uncharacterized protein (TIGR03067 family)